MPAERLPGVAPARRLGPAPFAEGRPEYRQAVGAEEDLLVRTVAHVAPGVQSFRDLTPDLLLPLEENVVRTRRLARDANLIRERRNLTWDARPAIGMAMTVLLYGCRSRGCGACGRNTAAAAKSAAGPKDRPRSDPETRRKPEGDPDVILPTPPGVRFGVRSR